MYWYSDPLLRLSSETRWTAFAVRKTSVRSARVQGREESILLSSAPQLEPVVSDQREEPLREEVKT